MTTELVIDKTWDGTPLPADHRALVQLVPDGPSVMVRVFAPFADDAPPQGPPGPTPGLWNHEVVEWFIVGPREQYLEVELGPHGHHLVLALRGVRNPIRQALPIRFDSRRCGSRWWTGTAWIPRAWIPPAGHTTNAYRISGEGVERHYHAHVPVPGEAPDFHRLSCFTELTLPETTTAPPVARQVVQAATALWGVPSHDGVRQALGEHHDWGRAMVACWHQHQDPYNEGATRPLVE